MISPGSITVNFWNSWPSSIRGRPQLSLDQAALDDRDLENVVRVELRLEFRVRELEGHVVLPPHELEGESRHEDEKQPEGTGPGEPAHWRSVVRRAKWVLFSHVFLLHLERRRSPTDAHKLAI